MKKTLFFAFLFIIFLAFGAPALAVTPTLSVSISAGDNVQVDVTGQANASVLLFYTKTGTGLQTEVIGNMNSSGTFSTTISSGSKGIAANSLAYVRVGGINGAQSNQVQWPYYISSSTSSTLTLNPSSILLNAGQSLSSTANANYLYLSSNSSPSVANVSLNGSQITVNGNTFGTTTAKICVVGSTSNCADLAITVQNSGASQLTFSKNDFSIFSNQSVSVSVYGGAGSYIISNNSNPSAIQAGINGSVIMLSATGTTGNSAITVCTSNMNYCGIINASNTAINSTAITFSQNSPYVALGQNATISIFGGTGTNFYVSSNSNPSIVQVNISSNVATLIANTSGTSAITICAYGGQCGQFNVTVGNAGGNNGPINLSQSSVSILAGQSTNIIISGDSMPYNYSSQNATGIFSANISNNVLTVYGVGQGSGTANICASAGCTQLNVTVNNISANTSNPPSFSQNSLQLQPGQQTAISVSGNGGLYIANHSMAGIVTASIAGNSLALSAIGTGTDNISVCQADNQCATLYITVAQPAPVIITPTTPTPTPATAPAYVLFKVLSRGEVGPEIRELQKLLVQKGYLSATPNGAYGPATVAAVKKFQKDNKLQQTGNVGPLTMAKLNQIWASMAPSQPSTAAQSLQAKLAELQAKLRALQNK